MQAPLLFVRGGEVSPGRGLYRAGNDGYYWSSVSVDSYYAYHLYFPSNYVDPSDDDIRYSGFSVRCVALGG